MASSEVGTVSRAGTLTYASPEKASSKPYDSKDDMWALGCIMSELVTGVPLTQRCVGGVMAFNKDNTTDETVELLWPYLNAPDMTPDDAKKVTALGTRLEYPPPRECEILPSLQADVLKVRDAEELEVVEGEDLLLVELGEVLGHADGLEAVRVVLVFLLIVIFIL